jgi:hypothetical protein
LPVVRCEALGCDGESHTRTIKMKAMIAPVFKYRDLWESDYIDSAARHRSISRSDGSAIPQSTTSSQSFDTTFEQLSDIRV